MIDNGTGEKKPTLRRGAADGRPSQRPRALDLDPKANLCVALREGNTVHRIDSKAGKIYHLAGTGEKGYTAMPVLPSKPSFPARRGLRIPVTAESTSPIRRAIPSGAST